MKRMNLLRICLLTALATLLTACGSIEKQRPDMPPADTPVEERDHGSISTYRFIPPPPLEETAKPERAPSSSAVSRLHADAKKQLAAKQYNAAASTLERALRIAPRNGELWHSLAVVRLQQQRWEMARNMAAKSNSLATADRPLQARNWRLIANSHRAQGNQQSAQEAWQRVRALSGS